MIDTNILIGLCTTGGAVLGTLITAMVRHFGTRAVNQAQASELITEAAQKITSQFAELNTELRAQLRLMRTSILLLTDIVDQIAPLVHAPPEIVEQLRRANHAAKMAYMGLGEGQEADLIGQIGDAARAHYFQGADDED